MSVVSDVTKQNRMMLAVQIFGLKNSQPTRAAERFFKERRIQLHLVDLKQRPMSPAEIKRFADRFGLQNLVDRESTHFCERRTCVSQALRWRLAAADRT